MRQITFMIGDGTTVDLEVQPQFEQIVRKHFEIDDDSEISDANIKKFFIISMIKASE
jgi:hypothetical protein